jgi:hypothetical protein
MWVGDREDEYTINISDTTCYIGLKWHKFAKVYINLSSLFS